MEKNYAVTPQPQNLLKQRVELLTKRDYRGKIPLLPREITPAERDCSLSLIQQITDSHRPILASECAAIILDITQFFWETALNTEALARQQALWYEVLKDHSCATITKVAMEWLREGKRKPTPADFLELANEIDQTPDQLTRLKRLASLPLQQAEKDHQYGGTVIGCPIELAKFIRYAKQSGIEFTERQQDDYIATGVVPKWYAGAPRQEDEKSHLPTREELLSVMTPEQRIAAINGLHDWNRP